MCWLLMGMRSGTVVGGRYVRTKARGRGWFVVDRIRERSRYLHTIYPVHASWDFNRNDDTESNV